ncbi:MAG: hypothetical protein BA870_01360 [Desulfuromonadales bacterium C00003094]|nr:MAG: hypothetical protein BA870_01360 [Desulfuromonadales bacterium C00003094]
MSDKHPMSDEIQDSEQIEDQVFEELERQWPAPVVARDQRTLDRFSGGLLNAKTLANHDSAGTGPEGKIKVGKKVAYPTKALVAWMIQRKSDHVQSCCQKRRQSRE